MECLQSHGALRLVGVALNRIGPVPNGKGGESSGGSSSTDNVWNVTNGIAPDCALLLQQRPNLGSKLIFGGMMPTPLSLDGMRHTIQGDDSLF
jgi:hypothetical protein